MTELILAIDPGNVESAYVVIDADDYRPVEFSKVPNRHARNVVRNLTRNYRPHDWGTPGTLLRVAVEQIGHYGTGMPAGRTVFDTCRQIGRLEQIAADHGHNVELVLRATVKTHLCGASKAKDGNVIQALIDRFAPDTRNRGKGTKAEPGWFYGFAADVWQAYALAVYMADNPEIAPF